MYEITPKAAREFFDYAKKRYQLMLDKEGGFPPPWTNDEVLQQYRFCNVFREDDKVTRWFRDNIRSHLFYDHEVVLATIIFRWFNKIETAERLLCPGSADRLKLFTTWQPDEIRSRLRGVSPIVTGAYMIKTPAGMSKLDGILWSIEQFVQPDPANVNPPPVYAPMLFEQEGYTLQQATEYLASFPYLGPFMAYEIVTDLRHTALLQDAPDILSWANPGPGAARGLDRLIGEAVGSLNRHSSAHLSWMMNMMQQLLAYSKKEAYWPKRWPKWEMREVEHTLCEFDKYERARLGEGTPKQRYPGNPRKGD